jgi:phage baseplate assembly protein W
MAQRRFSVEDGSIGTKSIVSARSRDYSDIDLTFTAKGNGDVYKKQHASAVKQAVKNLIMTNFYEKPFQPFFGGDITGLLFELADDDTGAEIEDNVRNALEFYEPRAKVLDINVNARPDNNAVSVRLEFQVINTEEIVVLETSISRLR